MGRFDTIKTTIDANIKTNGNHEITGQKLNLVLNEVVNATDAELTELESEVDDICGDVFTIDRYIDASNGSTLLSSTRKCTDYIKVAGLSKVRVYGGSNEYGVALCAFYDEDMSFLSSLSGNVYNKTEIEIDIPSDAYYIRCSSDENGVGKYFGTGLAQINQELSSMNNRVSEFAEEVKDIPKSLGFEDEIKTYSVLEKNGITLSVYGSPSMWDNGKIVSLSSSSYRIAINETIPVNPNETYSITTHFGDSYTKMMVHFYNSTTKQFSQADIDTSTLSFVTPSWCDTIMFTINKLYASKVLELDVLTTGKTGKLLNTKLVITEENVQSVKLCYGKKIVLFGDSQLGQARDYPSGATNMSVLLQNIVGGKVYNWGFGGCSMALRENADANWDAFSMVSLADAVTSGNYTNQDAAADNLKSDLPYASAILKEMKSENFADGENVIFFIAYGGNDYNNLCKLGDAASFDTKTYRGAINYSVKKLMSAFPKAKICLCGVAYRVFTYTSKTEQGITSDSDSTYNIVVENGSNQHYYRYTYNDALIEQGKHLHIPTFDKYYRAGRNRYNVWTLCPNDGVHPESLAGRTAEAEFYAAALRSL